MLPGSPYAAPKKTGTGHESYTMPKPCWAIVDITVEPLQKGSGLQFQSQANEKDIPCRYQNHVRISALETLRQGVYGWEVTDARVILTGGSYHHVHTHPLDFFVAAPRLS